MANKVIPYTGQDLCTGDVLIVKSPYIIIKHFAIVYNKNGVQCVSEYKPLSHGDRTHKLSDYLNKRIITGVVRDDKTMALTDDHIEKKVSIHDLFEYGLITYNCEDFIRDVCSCEIGLDQRKKFLYTFVLIIVGIALLYFIFRGK